MSGPHNINLSWCTGDHKTSNLTPDIIFLLYYTLTKRLNEYSCLFVLQVHKNSPTYNATCFVFLTFVTFSFYTVHSTKNIDAHKQE